MYVAAAKASMLLCVSCWFYRYCSAGSLFEIATMWTYGNFSTMHQIPQFPTILTARHFQFSACFLVLRRARRGALFALSALRRESPNLHFRRFSFFLQN
jgi:hypothetical protein